MNKEQQETLNAAKEQEQPLTIKQRIEELQKQYKEAQEVALRCEGAIMMLNELLQEKSK